jgi:hypothetical protein|tara:strand:+ start:233 stop:433 length:201 start_codon:yes stop_codon:yes gene_type:complete
MNTNPLTVGDIVYDHSYGMSGLIIERNAEFTIDGMSHTWHWGILYEDGELGYADSDELNRPKAAEQ